MLKLRRVREEDSRLLWEWANDPEVRSNSFSSKEITWEEHDRWFRSKVHEPNCLFFIALDDEERPIGQARIDLKNTFEAEIHVSVERTRRGLGYGSLLISTAAREVFRTEAVRTVSAFIKPTNIESTKAFEKAKFRKVGLETVRGNLAAHYVLLKSNEK